MLGVVLASVVAFGIALVFFLGQKRSGDATWERYRERHRQRQARPRQPEPPDPNLRFDGRE